MNQKPVQIKRALVSVSDKAGLVELMKTLQDFEVEIISTGGTARILEENNISYTPIQEVTGNPESFGGRMKTISFNVGSAILYRRDNADDIVSAQALKIEPIDMVICNFYPFVEALEKNVNEDELIENVDIGGPMMVRASAKNFSHVICITSPSQYPYVQEHLKINKGQVDFKLRRQYALEAFSLTAQYEAQVAVGLAQKWGGPEVITPVFQSPTSLRYGENPHQKGWIFPMKNLKEHLGFSAAKMIQGKELSYNNYLDADAAWKCAHDLKLHCLHQKQAAFVVVKHAGPCGMAIGENQLETLEAAWNGDSVSAFGGIVAATSEIDDDVAKILSERFLEIIIAPGFSASALKYFSNKKNLRLISLPFPNNPRLEKVYRSVAGAMLVQEEDEVFSSDLKWVTQAKPQNLDDSLLRFGIVAVKYLKSNALALVEKGENTLELVTSGSGQPNRLDCLKLLIAKRVEQKKVNLEKAVLISDAFFPFSDIVELASELGIKTIVQPGGSIRDGEVIKKANDLDLSMAVTGVRHFRH